MWIGLNPSTADEINNDPTVRRCIGYAQSWGYEGMCMTNIFAFRATDPKVMKAQTDPVGPDNDRHLIATAKDAKLIVAAWGVHGSHLGRGRKVRQMIQNLHYLALTKKGIPRHPLYLRKTLEPILWDKEAERE